MRQRAKRVDLKPEIEEACVRDLGMYCSDSEKYKPEQVSNLVYETWACTTQTQKSTSQNRLVTLCTRLGHVLLRLRKVQARTG